MFEKDGMDKSQEGGIFERPPESRLLKILRHIVSAQAGW
jgi:hypothetical protein